MARLKFGGFMAVSPRASGAAATISGRKGFAPQGLAF
jgi:hypothetical protein